MKHLRAPALMSDAELQQEFDGHINDFCLLAPPESGMAGGESANLLGGVFAFAIDSPVAPGMAIGYSSLSTEKTPDPWNAAALLLHYRIEGRKFRVSSKGALRQFDNGVVHDAGKALRDRERNILGGLVLVSHAEEPHIFKDTYLVGYASGVLVDTLRFALRDHALQQRGETGDSWPAAATNSLSEQGLALNALTLLTNNFPRARGLRRGLFSSKKPR